MYIYIVLECMRTATDFSRAEIGKTNVCAFCYLDNACVCVHVNMYVCMYRTAVFHC